jgi:quinol-cytochrome oxidoreductase complex cytochrome b subunit
VTNKPQTANRKLQPIVSRGEPPVNEEEKQRYKERYKEKKADGEMFFPDAIAKDAVVSLGIFILLILLVILLGVPNEPPANPSDSSYIPRPEWYFLWAFQLLKYFPRSRGWRSSGWVWSFFLGCSGCPSSTAAPNATGATGPSRPWSCC